MYKIVNGDRVKMTQLEIDARIAEEQSWQEGQARSEIQEIERKRREEYIKEGVTIEALTVALVEHIVENRPEALQALQVKREGVKIKYPTPVK